MKELHGIQAQLTGRCKPKDLVPVRASARRFSLPLPRSSSSSHGPPGTCTGQLLQVKAPAEVRWLKKLAHPLQGKPVPAGGWDCTTLSWSLCSWAEAAAPAWRALAAQVGTDRTGTQGHSCPLSLHTDAQPLHAAPSPWRSPGCPCGQDEPQPGWHRSQTALHLCKDFHLRISCQPKVTDNRVMTRICWNTLRLCFSTLGC